MLNKLILKKIWLKKDEVPILVIRKSAVCWLASWLAVFLILAVDFFLMAWLFTYDIWGILVWLVAIIIALVIFIRAYLEFYFTAWVLTNLRLIDIYQKGFWGREKTETVYNNIAEAYSKKQGLAGVFNLGDLYLTLKNSQAKLLIGKVRGYERALSEIILQQENYRQTAGSRQSQAAQSLLLKIKHKVGEKKFQQLIGD